MTDGPNDGVGEAGFPKSLPESDRPRWMGMTVTQRAKALDRLRAIEAWQAGDMRLDEALEASGLSRTRFYAVAAEFRAGRDLASLGAFAGSGAARQRLDPDAVNALQAVVAEVVATNRGASVSEQVRLMVEASGVDESSLPGATRLRAIIEAEIRRADATGQAGSAVKLDVTAINLPRADGRPHVMFVLIDQGTRLILGAATAATPELAPGYRLAARDARARVSKLQELRWADRLARAEITAGEDREEGAALRAALIDGGLRANVQMTAPGRYGRYFRQLVGARVGRIAITPQRTANGQAVPDNGDMTPWPDDAAAAAVTLMVEQHNAEVLGELGEPSGRSVMPDDLDRLLSILAA